MARRKQLTLPGLVPVLEQADGFAEVLAVLAKGASATIDGAWGSSSALTAACLAGHAPETLLIVLPRLGDIDEFADDLNSFLGGPPEIFPAWELLPQEQSVSDAVFGGRLRVLQELSGLNPPRVIVTSIAALLQPVPSREERRQGTRTLKVGEEIDLDEFLRWLVERGFERTTAIELPGEFSLHGGIVDIFPPEALDPLRLELFGDEIESIRRFDVETQRKLEELDEARLTVVAPPAVHGEAGSSRNNGAAGRRSDAEARFAGESLLDSLPPKSWIVLSELQELVEEGRNYLERLGDPRGLYSVEAALSRCTDFPTVTVSAIAPDSYEKTCNLQIESVERFTGPKSEVISELASVVARDERVLIACPTEGERQRLSELLAESQLPVADRVALCTGSLARGFRLAGPRIVVLSDGELFGRTHLHREPVRRKKIESRAIDSFLELSEGDLVVHLTKGIARYRGMKLLEKGGQSEEHLVLEFSEGAHIYVPVSLIHLVQKYIGGKFAPKLSKIGSSSWSKRKEKVAQVVMDLAVDMIQLQAAREAKPGIACPPDSHWQRDFEASFPYTETPDQLSAIADLKEDLERMRPMDRLICGDVGYGKTEVAVRAAFKTVDSGRQVAVLVPTTVLAEQHFRTFGERMAEYPVTIEVLSRFRTKAEQRAILDRAAHGAVDIVIGTHRIVQKDVQFKNLGLLIIDEEQRFGVEAKETLKRMRTEVDILTLSATPIPRTLHMSLLGIRDISNLTTAPQDRQAVTTRVCRFDGELIRQAIVRELNRNGQVYFVHNRVYNIEQIADRLRQIVPEARIDIGHGQMREHELEDAMLRFVSGRTDVLVCTTIIESGLDIPNANTIFIHQADKFGLADLHQLRGRVGRYKHRAYCYLLLEEGRSLTPIAAKRLKAIEEYSELGAGFKIAMRDLEIRGAGNILGTEQSGHIASVGYELYCQLLENAVRGLKNQPIREYRHVALDLPISAYLPSSYVPPGRHKIEVYRKLSSVGSLDDLNELAAELADRFGPIPEEARRLLELKELQLQAQRWQIDNIHLEDGYAVMRYRNSGLIEQLARRQRPALRIVDGRHAYLPLPQQELDGAAIAALLKSVLAVDSTGGG